MHNHAPPDYICPFCRDISRGESELPLEIVHRYEEVFVMMNREWWSRNPGGALVVTTDHHENVYDVPVELGTPLQRGVRDTAVAMKAAFGCDGISTRQNNEPGGTQDVWHFHIHVLPRYADDALQQSSTAAADVDELRRLAGLLRAVWPT